MKIVLFFSIFSTGLVFAQQKETKKLPKLKMDSTKILKYEDIIAKKLKKDSLHAKSIYKILCKKPDTSLYKMPNRKAKTEKMMALRQPTEQKPNVQYFVPEYKFPKIEKLEKK